MISSWLFKQQIILQFLTIQVWNKFSSHDFHMSCYENMLRIALLLLLQFAYIFPAKLGSKPSSFQDDFQKIYIKAVKCNGSENFVYKNVSCFAKSYSRSVSTMNIIGTAKKPLNNITVSEISKKKMKKTWFLWI